MWANQPRGLQQELAQRQQRQQLPLLPKRTMPSQCAHSPCRRAAPSLPRPGPATTWPSTAPARRWCCPSGVRRQGAGRLPSIPPALHAAGARRRWASLVPTCPAHPLPRSLTPPIHPPHHPTINLAAGARCRWATCCPTWRRHPWRSRWGARPATCTRCARARRGAGLLLQPCRRRCRRHRCCCCCRLCRCWRPLQARDSVCPSWDQRGALRSQPAHVPSACHPQGIMSAATYVHCNTAEALREAARRCPGWPVLVTGHSLGGACWAGAASWALLAAAAAAARCRQAGRPPCS